MDGFEFLQTAFGNAADVASAYFTQQSAEDAYRAGVARNDAMIAQQYAREDTMRSFTAQLTGTKWGYAVAGIIGLAVVALILTKKGR